MSRIWPLAGVVNLGLQAPYFADKYLHSVTEKWKHRYTKQQSANCQLKQHKMSEKLGFLKSKRPFHPKITFKFFRRPVQQTEKKMPEGAKGPKFTKKATNQELKSRAAQRYGNVTDW